MVLEDSDPLKLLDNWPKPHHAAGDLARTHNDWIRCLAQEVLELKAQMKIKDDVIKQLKQLTNFDDYTLCSA